MNVNDATWRQPSGTDRLATGSRAPAPGTPPHDRERRSRERGLRGSRGLRAAAGRVRPAPRRSRRRPHRQHAGRLCGQQRRPDPDAPGSPEAADVAAPDAALPGESVPGDGPSGTTVRTFPTRCARPRRAGKRWRPGRTPPTTSRPRRRHPPTGRLPQRVQSGHAGHIVYHLKKRHRCHLRPAARPDRHHRTAPASRTSTSTPGGRACGSRAWCVARRAGGALRALGGETGDVLGPLLPGDGVTVRSVRVGSRNGGYVHDRREGVREEVADAAGARSTATNATSSTNSPSPRA